MYELVHAHMQDIEPRLAIFACKLSAGLHLPPVRHRVTMVAILEARSKPS